jgi:hypothetical protein
MRGYFLSYGRRIFALSHAKRKLGLYEDLVAQKISQSSRESRLKKEIFFNTSRTAPHREYF